MTIAKYGFSYDYKFQGILNSDIKTDRPFIIKLIDYQQKGYGASFLTEVTKENMKTGCDLYYTGVSDDNIASRKTAEKAGYTIATSRMSVKVK